MKQKFALLSCVKTPEEIPVKLNIIKKMPILDWYVHKFNPYKAERLIILQEEGYKIKLPLTEQELASDPKKATYIIDRTMGSLKDYGVSVAMLPRYYNVKQQDTDIKIATGKDMLPFVIMDAIVNALDILQKELKLANIVILGDSDYAENFIRNIYPEVNFLSVLTNIPSYKYDGLADEIFHDTGLNIQISKISKNALSNADIIIDTSYKDEKFDFCFKRGAVYFNFSGNKEKSASLISKRDDMLIVDDLKVRCRDVGTAWSMPYFELIFFTKSRDYRYILSRGYNVYRGKLLKKQLSRLGVSHASYMQLGQTLNNLQLKYFFARSGITIDN